MKALRARLNAFARRPTVAFTVRLYKRYDASRLPLLAAALSYYAAFSLGPLLLLLAGWLGFFLRSQPELLAQYRTALTDLVAQLLPLQENTEALVSQSFAVILDQMSQGAVLRTVISFLILVWASSNFFTSLQLALEVIFDVPRVRGYWRKRGVAVLLVASVAVVIGVELVGGLLTTGLDELSVLMVEQLNSFNITVPRIHFRWGQGLWTEMVRFGVATSVFTLCFRYLPRESSSWLGASVGAFFSTVSILVTRYIFVNAFNIERFNLIYGVVTSFLVVLLWLYFALLMFLVGALIVAEISAVVRLSRASTPADDAPAETQQTLGARKPVDRKQVDSRQQAVDGKDGLLPTDP